MKPKSASDKVGGEKHENIEAVVSDSAAQPSKVGLLSAGCVS